MPGLVSGIPLAFKRGDMMHELLSTAEVAKRLNISMGRVRALIESGRLPAVNLSAGALRPRWNVKESDLEGFLAPKNVPRERKVARKRIDSHVPQKY